MYDTSTWYNIVLVLLQACMAGVELFFYCLCVLCSLCILILMYDTNVGYVIGKCVWHNNYVIGQFYLALLYMVYIIVNYTSALTVDSLLL